MQVGLSDISTKDSYVVQMFSFCSRFLSLYATKLNNYHLDIDLALP